MLNQLAQLPFALAATWEMGPIPLTNIKAEAERRLAGSQPGILICEKDPRRTVRPTRRHNESHRVDSHALVTPVALMGAT